MKLTEELTNRYKKYLKPGDTIIIACSGGCDSVALSHLTAEIAKSMGIRFYLAHLNHNLRGKKSAKDAVFVEKLGKTLEAESIIKSMNFKNFTEEKGRIARQKFYETTAEQKGARYIVLAHHADDFSEGIIMNFIRGGSLRGLKGMQEQNGLYLRPLLKVEKQELLTYLKKKKLKYREDSSNKSNKYTRNFYRNLVMPLLNKQNPNLNETLQKNAKNFGEIQDFMEQEAAKWLQENHSIAAPIKESRKMRQNPLAFTHFSLVEFRKLHSALQKAILRLLNQQCIGHLQELEAKHIEEVLDLLNNSHSGKRKNLGKYCEVSIKGKTFSVHELE